MLKGWKKLFRVVKSYTRYLLRELLACKMDKQRLSKNHAL